MDNKRLQVVTGLATETGRRDNNEDYVAVCLGDVAGHGLQDVVAAIADGVGGSDGGREAAETCVRSFIDGYYSLPEMLGVERAAAKALNSVNSWLVSQGRCDSQLRGMATTFSGLILRGRHAHIIHVGDCRIYRLRSGRLTGLTTDHTLNQPDLNHVLYRVVGVDEGLRADHALHELAAHDRYLLCSDGIHGVLKQRQLHELLASGLNPEVCAQQIVRAAYDAGSADNMTALVVEVLEVPSAQQSDVASVIGVLPIRDLPAPGQIIDGYRIGMMLSDGSYSRLYLADDTLRDDQQVVLKFPHPRRASDRAVREAFIREIWLSGRIRNPSVLTIAAAGGDRQGALYGVMPYCPGTTLEHRFCGRAHVGLAEGVEIGIRLGRIIHALHRNRIIHRDIKPDNVIIADDGNLKLLDLGVARLPGIEAAAAPDIPGTPSYMAPEMFAGNPGDEQTDLYALGVTLYRIFTGHYPYGEIEPFQQPRFTRPTALSRYRADIPAWLDAVVMKAIAVDPTQRYSDTLELAFELEHGLSHGQSDSVARQPLYQRNPLLVWQVLSLALLSLLIFSLAFR
ncbi:MAG: bifunctional protein-serine/threonine kinase/phosphatase [Gammaproteobacteria bacterium]|nr:bifunctional protein-serine/threonine kinase/phosphatase [Gammaproteobacteria bacterium]